MNGWMDEQADGSMRGWMDEQMGEQMHGWTDKMTERWLNDRWLMDEQRD